MTSPTSNVQHPKKLQDSSGNVELARVCLFTVLLLSFTAGTNSASEIALQCVEPDDAKGMAEAVIVEDAPLVHTMQVMDADAEGALNKLEVILNSAGTSLEN